MESESISGLWLFAVLGGTVILGLVLAYAGWQWRHRRRGLDRVREEVTRTNYSEGDTKS